MRLWGFRKEEDKVSSEYMIDSTSSGPRPYDTETLDRKTAASVLSTQPGGLFAHPPRSVVAPMTMAYAYDQDSSGGSNGSVISRFAFISFFWVIPYEISELCNGKL